MGKDTDQEDVLLEDLEDEDVTLPEEDDNEDLIETDDEDNEEGDEDDDKKTSPKAKTKGEVKFTDAQKAVIEDLIQARLDRSEQKLDREIRAAAGVEVNRQELFSAVDLWGFLKLNPELSDNVQRLIDEHISSGKFVRQDKRETSAREDALSKREAVLDLKASDTYFARHSKEIVEWAEDEGFEIVDAKSLKRAYMAYRGANQGVLDRADTEHRKKQQEKAKARQGAKVATGGGRKTSPGKAKNTDFSKMSDADILAATGQKLFTDD